MEAHNIPPSLIINFDQIPLKNSPVSNSLSKKGSKHVPIAGIVFKKSITATFDVTYSNTFLPMQLIYKGKKQINFSRVISPPSFLLSANMKHFSTTQESIDLLNEIIKPYVEKESGMLNLDEKQPAILIIMFFQVKWQSLFLT